MFEIVETAVKLVMAVLVAMHLAAQILFWRKARLGEAKLEDIVDVSITSDSSFDVDGTKPAGHQLTLTVKTPDGSPRAGKIRVGSSRWDDAKVGDTVEVRYLLHKPRWIFWSPMIRPTTAWDSRVLVVLSAFVLAATVLWLFEVGQVDPDQGVDPLTEFLSNP